MFELGRITALTLDLIAEWGSTTPLYMARELQSLLVNAKPSRLAVIPGARTRFLSSATASGSIAVDPIDRVWLNGQQRDVLGAHMSRPLK
jgi:hypothetical protein